jgi:type II secretion system protein C
VYLRFPKPYVALLNFFLIAMIAYSLALAASNAIKLHLAGIETAGTTEFITQKRLLHPQTGLRQRAYYETIVRRDIFSRATPASTPAPVQEEPLDITLIGTSHLNLGKPYIIVETTDGEQSLYRQGETIPNVGRVLSIGRSQAIVLHNGHRVALKIPNAGDEGTSQPEQPAPFGLRRHRRFMGPPRFPGGRPMFGPFGALGPNGGIHRLSPNRYAIGRTTVDRSLSNMGPLLSQIRAAPNQQDGSPDGFRLSQIQPGSIFQQIGLQDGDIVTGAEGQQVNDPMHAMIMLSVLRNSPSITLNVIRNGSPLNLYYAIH